MPTELLQKSGCVNRLSHNELPFSPPLNLEDCLKTLCINRYPESAYEGLTTRLATLNAVTPESLILSNGSDECIRMIIDAFSAPGEAIVIPTPTFTQYAHQAQVCYRRPMTILQPGFLFDLKQLAVEVRRYESPLIFLCSPNNPTGAVLSEKDLRYFLENTACTVVLDEAYSEFSTVTMAALIGEYPRLIIMRTLSKAYGLAGLRIGYCMTSPENIQKLGWVRGPYALSSLSEKVGLLVLSDLSHYAECLVRIQCEKNRFLEFLKHFTTICVYPSQANFVLIDAKDDFNALKSAFEKTSIALRYFDEPYLKNHLRITIGDFVTMKKVKGLIKAVLT